MLQCKCGLSWLKDLMDVRHVPQQKRGLKRLERPEKECGRWNVYMAGRKTGRQPSIRFNYMMNMIYTVSGMVFPLLVYPYATRTLGESGIGAVSFANSIISCFGIFAQLGIPTYGIRACAEVRGDREKLSRTFQEILLISLVTCTLTYLVFLAAVFAYPRFRSEKELFLVMGSLLFFQTIGAEWLYKGLEQYSYITWRSLLFKTIALAAVFLLIREEGDYVIYGGITIFALVGSNVLNFLNLRKYVTLRPAGSYRFRRHLKPIAVFLAMSVATTIYTNMDSAMLGILKGTAENGYYDVAVKVKNILVSVVSSLGTVLLPRMAFYISSRKEEEFRRVTRRALLFVLELSLPLCLYFILFAAPSVRLLAGGSFGPSVRQMQLIMPTLVLIGFTNVTGMQMLVPLGREREVLYSEIAGACVNLVINAALIPSLGGSGAAIGTVAAELTVLAVQVFCMRHDIVPLLLQLPFGKLGAALALAGLSCAWVRGLPAGSFVQLALSAVLFFSVYAASLLLMKEDLACGLFRQMTARIRSRE